MIKGKVYKITGNNKVYFGSTIKKYISQRMGNHMTSYRNGKSGGMSHLVISDPNYKVEVLEIIEIEDDEDKKKLLEREFYYINNFECVNKVKNMQRGDLKEYYRKWYAEHREHRRNYMKEYRARKKDPITFSTE